MFELTKNEIQVLKVFALIIFLGAAFQCLFKFYPDILNLINLEDSQYSYLKIDVNSATQDELVEIPFIGKYTAKKIIDYRQKNGPFSDVSQIRDLGGIREENFNRFSHYLKVRSHGKR